MSEQRFEPLRAPQSFEATLENGLRVVVVPLGHLQGASLSVFVKVGPRYERAETNGISHFLEHMLFRGTPSYPTAYDLSFAAEQLGGAIDAATYADFTHYQLGVPREHAGKALELLAELLRAPRFGELALEKKIVREEILADRDADGREVDAENLSRLLVYGDHALGFKITGEADNVEGFGPAELHAHLSNHYGAANMAVVATGAVEPEAIVEHARRLFGDFPRGRLTLVEEPPPARHDERLRFVNHDASQSDVRVCLRAFGPDDPHYTALKLMVRILDDGMSTRLHRRLTDESGLAYEAFAALDPYEETGLLEVGASVEHEKVPEVLSAILGMLHELTERDVEPRELEKARTRYAWTLRRLVDSPEDMALYAGTQAVFGRAIDLSGLWSDVAHVTAADIRAAAQRIVRASGLHIVSVGRAKKPVQKQAERVVAGFVAQHAR
ncbi:MAG: pitrilysin family protein [Myxococcales bacterium]